MNQHQIQTGMSKTAYSGTHQVELADGHFGSSGNNRGSDGSTNDARRGKVGRMIEQDDQARGRRARARRSSRREGAKSGRRGSSTVISSILDGTDSIGIIDHLLAQRLHFVLLHQKHSISNHRNNIPRSKVIPIFGCLSNHERREQDELTAMNLSGLVCS